MDWLETLLRSLQVSSCFYGIYSTLFWVTKFSGKLPLWKKGDMILRNYKRMIVKAQGNIYILLYSELTKAL